MKVNLGRYPKSEKTERTLKVQIDRWDCWDAQHTLSLIILPLLIEFKEKTNGYPIDLTEKGWNDILDKMIFSFTEVLEDRMWKIPTEELKEYNTKVQEGLDLFGKHFRSLWW